MKKFGSPPSSLGEAKVGRADKIRQGKVEDQPVG